MRERRFSFFKHFPYLKGVFEKAEGCVVRVFFGYKWY
jgi:hypothetical protein